eukprot:CAMPEP_0206589688 /NCGR_PEP_ID=MMETSP0325_2-20121206/39089_1 /ASSEMBLY_ACC=CAM_ASM_000347 /TAXON_ID=2866 /ORGANISM="Crypthecodinium cohnii, Strain Seligo" /LENGTH=64 /DNA_ID=CAMNT_0054098329 /DNA_START=73 /DNA_END=264 /DNA_ORIENTATION=+
MRPNGLWPCFEYLMQDSTTGVQSVLQAAFGKPDHSSFLLAAASDLPTTIGRQAWKKHGVLIAGA